MPQEAVRATSTNSSEVSGMFEQAFRALGDSFKAAMKAQEDTVKLLSEAVGRVNPGHAVGGEWIPTAEKNAEEYLRLLESSYHRNADLLRKVIHRQKGGDGVDLETRTRDWVEASMEVVRDNAQDLASTTLRVAQSWSEVFKKGAQQGAQQKAAVGK